MENIRLALLKEPSVEEALARVQQHGAPPTTYDLIHFDRFTRIFCPCGRHTYGDLEPEKLTLEKFTLPVPVSNEYLLTFFALSKKCLLRAQKNHTKHEGRKSHVCWKCTCTIQGTVTGAAPPGHHHVLDLTRSWRSLQPNQKDKYRPPVAPLWQGAPFCRRFIDVWHDSTAHILIERTDGLWVYVATSDCSATPGYRCYNHTSVYWSESFEQVWNTSMTQVVRQTFWKDLRGHNDGREVRAINYYGIHSQIRPIEAAKVEEVEEQESDTEECISILYQ